jgi:transcriptional regulator with XRE-family HTH domain
MITSTQLRAARALLGIDQRRLAELSGLSVPTIQRMEASEGVIRGNVDSLMKLVDALGNAGIELIGAGAVSGGGGRGVRLKEAGGEAKPSASTAAEDENAGTRGTASAEGAAGTVRVDGAADVDGTRTPNGKSA